MILTLPPPLPDRSDNVKLKPPDIRSALMDPENVNVSPWKDTVQLMPPGNLPPTEVVAPAAREMELQVQ